MVNHTIKKSLQQSSSGISFATPSVCFKKKKNIYIYICVCVFFFSRFKVITVALIKSSVLGCYTVSTGRFRRSEDA